MKLRLAAIAVAIVALAGCSATKGAAGTPPADLPATAASTPAAAFTPAPGRPIALAVKQTSLGATLTVDGLTVYRFESDTNKPPTSACSGKCLTSWPALLTDGTAVRVDPSIDSTTVGVLARSDGSVQVTLNGWPLYRFAQDKAPGDVKGEGVQGKWSAVDGAAKPLKKK
jgi:predicted lipoprotein with Yx(FWY)xxD motif